LGEPTVTGQEFVALLAVIAAASWLGRRAWRSWRDERESDGTAAGTGCSSCGSKRRPDSSAATLFHPPQVAASGGRFEPSPGGATDGGNDRGASRHAGSKVIRGP
jgi:hypothetical protein